MSRRRKKLLTYATMVLFNTFNGVEYAVILPTLYFYLESFGANVQYLGLTLSAFSFGGLFSGPIMGCMADKIETKYILLFANLWEIGGNLLYFAGISPIIILLSRLIAGVGSGVGAAVTADIARSTTVAERTSMLALFMACQQIGNILGPACNLFLMQLNFPLGPFKVTPLAAPGAFMAILWIILEILICFCYFDLPQMAAEERLESQIAASSSLVTTQQNESENYSAPIMTNASQYVTSRPLSDTIRSKSYDALYTRPDTSTTYGSLAENQKYIDDVLIHQSDYITSVDCEVGQIGNLKTSRKQNGGKDDFYTTGRGQFVDVNLGDDHLENGNLGDDRLENGNLGQGHARNPALFDSQSNVSQSNVLMEEAEEFICTKSPSRSSFAGSCEVGGQSSLLDRSRIRSVSEPSLVGSVNAIEFLDNLNIGNIGNAHCCNVLESHIPTNYGGVMPVNYGSVMPANYGSVGTANYGIVMPANYGSVMPDNYERPVDSMISSDSSTTGSIGAYINEYCREAVVVVMFSSFAVVLNQSGLEAMLTPLTQTYLNWSAMENSYLFLGAGFLIILVFVLMTLASRKLHDVTLLIGGYILLVMASVLMIYYFPTAPPGNPGRNLIPFLSCVVLNLAGLPPVFACTASLLSKVTSQKTQGFSQGLSRSMMGIGAILGPIWAGSTIQNLYLMFGVQLTVILVALFIIIISCRHLKQTASHDIRTRSSENSPLLT